MPISKIKQSGLDASALTGSNISDGTIAAADLATDAVTTVKIADDAITTAKLTNDAVTTVKIADTVNLGRRNLIINGAMQVAQRGTSATVGPNGTGEGYTVVDRFLNSLNGSVVSTFTQSTDAPSGFGNSAKIEITTADSSLGSTEFWNFRYSAEGQDLQRIAKGTSDAKKITLSFYVKSNKTGTYTVELEDTDNNRLNALAYTVDSANTWERKTLTFNADTSGAFTNDNNLSLRINFWLCSGSQYQGGTFFNGTWGGDVDANRVHNSQVNLGDTVGNEWYITGVQLEIGDTATPFEHRSYGEELAICQRYYQHIKADAAFDYGALATAIGSTSRWYMPFPLKTEMRIDPTLSFSDVSHFRITLQHSSSDTCSALQINYNHNERPQLGCTAGSNSAGACRIFGFNGNASAYIALDAEL